MTINGRQRRVYRKFADELDDIKRKRIASGLDKPNRPISDERITRVLLGNPNWPFLKADAIRKPRDESFDCKVKKKLMGRKGSAADLFIWIIVGFITLLFLGVWVYGHNILTKALIAVPTVNGVNVSSAAIATFGQLNDAMPLLRTVSFTIILGMALSILISNFFIRTHPFLFIVYILFVVASVVLGAYISNAYDTVLANDVVGTTFQTFTATNFIMANLPVVAAVIGVFGAILLFINMQRDPDLVGGII